VRDFADRVKRLLVGRPVPSQALGETLLPKRIALPVFASDALSSAGPAPDAELVTIPGAAHGFGDANWEEAMRRTIGFLAWNGVLEED